jgi:isopentenyldiphosphate isomerase
METELFDVLDCTCARTGSVIERDAAHASGTWHGAVHCLAVFPRNSRAAVLFQKRSARKKIAPNRFDVTAGGHYAAGETAETAGPREIREELGLTVRFDQLVPLGRRTFVYCFTPGVREFEFQDVFLLPLDGMPGRLVLQESEVEGLLELDVEQGIELFSGKVPSLTATLSAGAGSTLPQTVAAADFVPCLDNYYLKLLVLARRYMNGEREALAI